MDCRKITRLAVRIVGLLIFLSALAGLPSAINAYSVRLSLTTTYVDSAKVSPSVFAPLIAGTYFGGFAIYAAIGLVLVGFSSRFVSRLVPSHQEVRDTDGVHDLEIVLLAVLGLYFFADRLAELIKWVTVLGMRYSSGERRDSFLPLFWTGDLGLIVQAIVKLLIGTVLLMGKGGSAALWHRLCAWVEMAQMAGLKRAGRNTWSAATRIALFRRHGD